MKINFFFFFVLKNIFKFAQIISKCYNIIIKGEIEMKFIKRNSKNIIIGILFILFISASIIIFYLLNNPKVKVEKEIIGNVIIADSKYLMIESNNENYLISNIKDSYEIGDKVKFIYYESNMNNEKNPKEIKVIDEEIISKNNNENKNSINNNENKTDLNNNDKNNINDNNITNNKDNNIEKPDNKYNNSNNINSNNNKKENADNAVINYLNKVEAEMDKPSLGESAKEYFVTIIDFIFYKGTIKGYTFNELSNSVKLKVLSSALYFDSKIDKYFPGYKESISSTTKKIYTNVKAGIISTYLEITTTICNSNDELCASAKIGFQSLKKNFGLTFDLIKEIAGDGINNLKNWYEIWSGK